MCFCRLKQIDDCVEKFLEEFNTQVQRLTADEFKKLVSCSASILIFELLISTLLFYCNHRLHSLYDLHGPETPERILMIHKIRVGIAGAVGGSTPGC